MLIEARLQVWRCSYSDPAPRHLFSFIHLGHRFFCFFVFVFIFWLCHAACGILVPWPGIEPRPTAVKALSRNHWTTREFPLGHCFEFLFWQEAVEEMGNALKIFLHPLCLNIPISNTWSEVLKINLLPCHDFPKICICVNTLLLLWNHLYFTLIKENILFHR